MSKSVQIKAALVVLLVAAGLIGRQSSSRYDSTADWFLVGLTLFGVLNVVVSTPGTLWVRTIAIAGTLAALVWPATFLGIALPLAVWVWPPAFTIAFGAAGGSRATRSQEGVSVANRARIAVAALVGAVALASLAYQGLVAHGLQQTAALFVGLPALLAIVVIFSVTPRTATGVACKAVTVGLLVSILFLGEGILCVVMSAPLFYAIAVAIASSVDLILELEEARAGLVRWRAVSDSSHVTHFLTWREVIVQWEPVDAHTTKVTWTLRYRRGLDPSWYFGPMERYAARLAAGYLIDSVATP